MYRRLRTIGLVASLSLLSACGAKPKPLSLDPTQAFKDPKQVALAAAAAVGDVRKIEAVVKAGADVNREGNAKITALWYAFTEQRKKAFKRLLELGADPNAPNETGEPLIGWCLMVEDIDYLKLALAHGGNPNAINAKMGQPIIFRALDDNQTDKLELLIKAGADINSTRGDVTLIIDASSARNIKTVLCLLQHGANPFLRDSLGRDIAAGLFAPNWDERGEGWKVRTQVLNLLESRGVKFDWSVIAKADIFNLGEATGKEPPRMLKNSTEPNPEWVKAHPKEAEEWYQRVMRRPAPRY